MITPDQLAHWRALAERATAGPWVAGWSGNPTDEGQDGAGPINIVGWGLGSVAHCEPVSGHRPRVHCADPALPLLRWPILGMGYPAH